MGYTLYDTQKKLHNVRPNLVSRIHFPNASAINTTDMGDHLLNDGLLLKNVLYLPSFQCNLVSISKLSRDSNCSVNFYPRFVTFQDISNGRVMQIAKETNGLYTCVAAVQMNSKALNVVYVCSGDVWHKRLRHISDSGFPKIPSLKFFNRKLNCHIYPLTKQRRLSFNTSNYVTICS